MVMQLVKDDPYLANYEHAIQHRLDLMREKLSFIDKNEGGFDQFTGSKRGFVVTDSKIIYTEWAPGAKEAYLIGDFNGWNRESHPMTVNDYGVWRIELFHDKNQPVISHGSKVKISMITNSGERIERIPAWIKYAVQDLNQSPCYEGVFWNPPKYEFKHQKPSRPASLRIYESHGIQFLHSWDFIRKYEGYSVY
jgi:1,4-alpha-glucan branching enzyme